MIMIQTQTWMLAACTQRLYHPLWVHIEAISLLGQMHLRCRANKSSRVNWAKPCSQHCVSMQKTPKVLTLKLNGSRSKPQHLSWSPSLIVTLRQRSTLKATLQQRETHAAARSTRARACTSLLEAIRPAEMLIRRTHKSQRWLCLSCRLWLKQRLQVHWAHIKIACRSTLAIQTIKWPKYIMATRSRLSMMVKMQLQVTHGAWQAINLRPRNVHKTEAIWINQILESHILHLIMPKEWSVSQKETLDRPQRWPMVKERLEILCLILYLR